MGLELTLIVQKCLLVATMSSMNGTDLSRRGTWLCSLLVNTSVNWPLNSLAFSKSDWARPLPCLFFKGGIPWVSFLQGCGNITKIDLSGDK